MSLDPRSFKGLSRFLAPSAGGPIADRAVSEKLITLEQLQECVDLQDRSGQPLDEILVEQGYLRLEDVIRLRAPAVPPEAMAWVSDPARNLGHYVLVSLLGTGGSAEVWKAWDRSLGRWVAVKFLKREVGHPTQRIEREGRMAGQLSHPSIITIFERGKQDGRAYLVMPFVDGKLPKLPLPPREAARLALEVSRALVHAHGMGVIHRDVKPANILVDAGGRVVLTDFGLAIPDESATSRWAMSGTPEYASPEQIRGDPLDARTDIYSLGATLYHLLSGRPPFGGSGVEEITQKVLNEEAPPLQGVPGRLRGIVRRAMAKDRERRHPSAEAFAAELASWIESSRASSGRQLLWVGVALLSAGLSWGATFIILSRSHREEGHRLSLESMRDGDRKMARAEQHRSDPAVGRGEIAAAARDAIVDYNLALHWSGADAPEINLQIGRCHELAGELSRAEEAFRSASALPAARSALAWLWARHVLEKSEDRDWRAAIRGKVEPTHPASLLAERKWSALLACSAGDHEEEPLAIAQGVAAIELKDWAQAVRLLDRGLKLWPRDSTALYYKGIALAAEGDRAGAKNAWAEAIRFMPSDWPLATDLARRQNSLTQ